MNDTSHQVEELLTKIWREKSSAERLRMGCSMFDFAKELVLSRIRREHAPLSAQTEHQELLLRFYGDQLSSVQKEKILKYFLRNDSF